MAFVPRDKINVTNISVSRRNDEVRKLVEEFADLKGMSRSNSLFDLSKLMLHQMSMAKGVLQYHR